MNWFRKSWEDPSFKWSVLILFFLPILWDLATGLVDIHYRGHFTWHHGTKIGFWGVLIILLVIQRFRK